MKKLRLKDWLRILKSTFLKWWSVDPFRQSAVIAYYAIFSLPALLVIAIYLAGAAFGEDAVNGKVADSISSVLGHESAVQIQDMLVKASHLQNSLLTAIVGVITLLFGATGVFIELQKSLNFIWEVKPKAGQGIVKMLKDRLFSFGLVVSIGFLLTISLIITSLLTYLSGWITVRFSLLATFLIHAISLVLSLTTISSLFALMFKVLPDVKTQWRYIWPGAILTGMLFLLGKFALGFYFGKFHPASIYGAAGTIVLVLLWVSYSCMILFYGAEFTKQFSQKLEGEVSPASNAVRKKSD